MPAKNSKYYSKMNTNRDETMLARWLEDDLQGADLAAFEAGAGSQPEHLAMRADVRRLRSMVAAALPAAEEPPYPDFFNSRVERAIRERAHQPAAVSWWRFFWHPALMPVAACASMALAFWLGTQIHSESPAMVSNTPTKAPLPFEPFVYAPEIGVKVERFASSDAEATVIVLDGIEAIPDAMDFSKNVVPQKAREIDSTADLEPDSDESLSL